MHAKGFGNPPAPPTRQFLLGPNQTLRVFIGAARHAQVVAVCRYDLAIKSRSVWQRDPLKTRPASLG